MNSKTTIPISEARKRIFEIAEEVQKPDTYYLLTEKGRPKAVLMSFDQFDSILDDLEIMSDPKSLKNIQMAEEAYRKGEYYTWDEVKKELGFVEGFNWALADKSRKISGKKPRTRKTKRS